jgi:hypothetical protein
MLVCAAMVAASCGGDDDSGSDAASTTVSTSPGVDADEDASIAEDAVLQLSDLPTGWREETPEDEDDDSPFDDDACGELQTAGDAAKAVRTANADSGHFVQSQAEIDSSVAAYAAEEAIADVFEQFDDTAQANECLTAGMTKAVKDSAEPGVEVRDVSVGRTSLGDFGDESISYQVEIEIEAEGLTPSVFADLVLVRVDRYAALFSFIDVLSPVDTELEQDAVQAVVGRLVTATQ